MGTKKVQKRTFMGALWRYKWLYLLLLPVIAYFVIFKYVPMYGIIISFQDYNVFKGVMGSRFVGLEVFKSWPHPCCFQF